jgi:cyclophilin family peptidyl-prolyl cis-trans isomerase/HEAT repeat protein
MRIAVLLTCLMVGLGGRQPSEDLAAVRTRLLAAEDARGRPDAQRAVIVEALDHRDVEVRTQAVRAAGRLEDPALADAIAALLADPSIDVRVAAAHAVAQSATSPESVARVQARLAARLRVEGDGLVLGALATSLGRLGYVSVEELRAASTLLAGLVRSDSAASRRPSVIATLGVARGAAALARRCAALNSECPELAALLRQLGRVGVDDANVSPPLAARIRRLGAGGLVSLGAMDGAARDALRGDIDDQVRRLVVIGTPTDGPFPRDLLRRWLGDPSPLVRQAAAHRHLAGAPALAAQAFADPHPHVRLAAIDALGEARTCDPCAGLATTTSTAGEPWQQRARALVAWARTRPDVARSHVRAAAEHRAWQVRQYAARAAHDTTDIDLLRTLARDPHPNVREAALGSLDTLGHRESDDVRIEALSSDDYQLVMTAARGLADTPQTRAAAPALVDALGRIAAHQYETSRDTRLAVIERLIAIGGPEAEPAVRACLRDFDPVIAARAADALIAAGHAFATPAQRPLPAGPVADAGALAALDGRRVTLSLQAGGDVVIRLDARNAPLNVARFVEQVNAGEWDGLTFHRVAPGFVVQGGSPGANEYAGAARFTRDERSDLSHVRGTVGISTRGRDTGDGQIFINLVDNPRLDHAYTIIGAVVAGLAHVDDMLEGAVIASARLEP